MPYKSKKQKIWMHINKPKLAKKWDKNMEQELKGVKRLRLNKNLN